MFASAENETVIPRLYSLYRSHCTDWATLAQLLFVGTQIKDKTLHIYKQPAQQENGTGPGNLKEKD